MIRCKRIYPRADPDDGIRVVVEQLWPRGISKSKVVFDLWLKQLALFPELRRWIGHDPVRWEQFRLRYREESGSQPRTHFS